MIRIAHASHRWNHNTGTCRFCGCSAPVAAALEACPSAPPGKAAKQTAAPSVDSLNRALTAHADIRRTP